MKKIDIDADFLEISKVPDFEEYQYWQYLKDRQIIINTEIDMGIVNRAVLQILQWNKEDDENNIPTISRKPIELIITSNGGCVISGFSLIDAIEYSKTPVITTGIGVCASMAAIILLSGHKRRCFKNTTILLHDGSLQLQSTSKKAKQTMAFYDELEDRIKNLILSKTEIPKEMYEEKEDEEWYLFGDKGLELGIVDELI